jgi:hypothetical protein
MSAQMPTYLTDARTAWSDLIAVARANRWVAAAAVIACSATSLANLMFQSDEATLQAITLGLCLAIVEAFLLTPALIACHRFVILGEITQGYASNWLTPRFWRFFLLSAALIATVFVPVLLMRWRLVPDDIMIAGFCASVLFFLAAGTWLSLMFPAIAVDAPGMTLGNAVSDIRGNVRRIFWVGIVANLPLLLATFVVGVLQSAIFGDAIDHAVRVVFILLEGAMIAALYVLLVLIASRFYLLLGSRLTKSG